MDPLADVALQTNFGTLDWVIVVGFLLGSTAAGLIGAKYVQNLADFVVAGRVVRTHLGVASMIAAEMGLVTVMYNGQMGFTAGFAAFHIAVIASITALIVGLTGFIVVPLREAGVMTIPEYYEQRFGRGVRLMGGAILALSGILNMGMFLKADSLFVTSVMGMTSDTQLKIAMTVLIVLVLLYTTLGGMIAVLITDYLQFTLMAVALVATSYYLMNQLGWGNIVFTVEEVLGDPGFNPFNARGFGAGYVLWMFFLGLASCALWQTAVIRAASAEDIGVVRRTYAWGSIGFLVRVLVPVFWGAAAMAYLYEHPTLQQTFFQPMSGGVQSELSLRAMPIALAQIIPAGAIGILTAAMLAAAMSTYNTYLHSWSAVLTQDVFGPLLGERLQGRSRIVLTQVLMLLIAAFLLIWGLWYPLGQNLWDYMAITGAIYFAGAFAVLVAGIYWPRASKAGAYAAFACGFLALAGLGPVQSLLRVNWRTEYVGLGTIAACAVAVVVVSLLLPDPPRVETPEAGQEH